MEIKKIMETLEGGREVAGTVLINKLNGKKYEISEVDLENNTVTATEVLPEDAKEEAETDIVMLTEVNEKCFSYRFNPNEKPAPTASVVAGKLVVGDSQVIMGNIEAVEVLTTVPNEVLFTTKGTQDGTVDVKRYVVDADRFDTIMTGASDSIRAEKAGKMVILIENKTTLIVQRDKDGNPILDNNGNEVTKPRFDGSYVYQYTGTSLSGAGCTDEDEDDDDDYFGESTGDGIRIEAPIDKIELISYGADKTLVVTSVDEVDSDGYILPAEGNTLVTLLSVSTETRRHKEVEILRHTYSPLTRKVKGVDPVVTITREDRIVFTIMTDKMVDIIRGGRDTVIDNETIASGLSGFNRYVGTETDGDTSEVSFADENYGVKTVTIRHTADRGDIISI